MDGSAVEAGEREDELLNGILSELTALRAGCGLAPLQISPGIVTETVPFSETGATSTTVLYFSSIPAPT